MLETQKPQDQDTTSGFIPSIGSEEFVKRFLIFQILGNRCGHLRHRAWSQEKFGRGHPRGISYNLDEWLFRRT